MRKLFGGLVVLGALSLLQNASVAQDRASSSGSGPKYQQAEPANRLSFLSRMTAQNDERDEREKREKREDAAGYRRISSEAAKRSLSTDEVRRYRRSRSSAEARAAAAAAARTGARRSSIPLQKYQKQQFGRSASSAEQSAGASEFRLSATPRSRAKDTGRNPFNTAESSTAESNAKKSPETRQTIREAAIRQAVAGGSASAERPPFEQSGGFPSARKKDGVVHADRTQNGNSREPIRQTTGTSGAPRLPGDFYNPALKSRGALLQSGGPEKRLSKKSLSETPADVRHLGRRATPRDASRIPTGGFVNFTEDSPHLETRWKKQSDINVGQPCEVLLSVHNSGKAAASNVAVEVFLPRTVRLTKASPEPSEAEQSAVWTFPNLDAGEERRIVITMIPSERGEITANANVRYSTASTTQLAVEEPMLKLTMSGSDQAMIGEPAPQVVTVANPGTGVSQNVTLEVTVPEGLEHPKGKRLKMDLGSLNAGERRSVRLSLTALAGGAHQVEVSAKSGPRLREKTTTTINVLAPSLKLTVDGPALRYVDRDARYSLTLTNDGQAATNNVRAMYVVPEGFEFLLASRGGKYDSANRTVTWFVGSVPSKETVEMSLKLKPVKLGDFAHVARAVSEHGARAETRTGTKIEGTASLVLEVLDRDDPVETGLETAYEIRVRNEGSKEAKKVGMSFELPSGVKLVDVNGPSKHIAESGLVVFRALPVLQAGKTAIFQIHVKGSEEGNHRVRARLTSDSIQEPLTVEELTRFYSE